MVFWLLEMKVRKVTKKPASGQLKPSQSLTPAQKREVKKLVSHVPELKWSDLGFLGLTVSATASVSALTLIAQGQSSSQRIGDSIHVDHFQLRYHVLYGDANQYVRVIIFQWHPISTPAATDILSNGVTGSIDAATSFHQVNTKQQYSILSDKSYDLLSTGDSFAHECIMNIRRGFQKTITANSTSGTSTTNKIYVLCISDSTVVPHPTVTLNLRTFYRDE